MVSVHSFSTPVLQPATNLDPNPNKGGGDIQVTPDGKALVAEVGPSGTQADIEATPTNNGQISIYVVRPGDTLSEIAEMYDVTANTVLWANDLKSSKDIHPGDTLVILPIEGVQHKVVKGETLASIVKKYKGDMAEVLAYNGLSSGAKVSVGDELIIPHGVESAAIVASASVTSSLKSAGGPTLSGYYLRPIAGGRKTQGLHGYNGIDFGTPVGTQIMASAAGSVVIARSSGYNGGYGAYIVVQHSNGTQTLYAHLSQVYIGVGAQVSQGQVIGLSGNSGRSTGAHLHFEVRGATNPF